MPKWPGWMEPLWDSIAEIRSTRLPYWLRKPKAPEILKAPDLSAHRDKETLDLFGESK